MRTFLLLVAFIISVAASFYAGTRVGKEQQYLGSAQYRMMEHYGYIKQLTNHPVTAAQDLANKSMDLELITHMEWVNSKWHWLFPEFVTENDKYGRAAAEYRLAHPFVHKPIDLSGFPPEQAEHMRQREAEIQQETKNALNHYRG